MSRLDKLKSLIGFTLIELMVVLVIIGILIALISAGIFKAIESAKIRQTETEISNMEMALEMYKQDVGYYPEGIPFFLRLNYLVYSLEIGPIIGKKGWNGPYMHFDEKRRSGLFFNLHYEDVWGNRYGYVRGDFHFLGFTPHNSHFDLWSSGPDGESGTDDDITNW